MSLSVRKSLEVKEINKMVIDLPTPSSISYLWSFGSLLGMFFFIQMLSGLFLAMNFSAEEGFSFVSVIHIMSDVEMGWLMRVFHANGASFFFMFLYFHIGRGLYYGSFSKMKLWVSGVSIFLMSMVTAFLGYVLPWGQMSFWAATVITNLLSVVPYLGKFLVEWLWGGFAVGNSTLVRFFSFHFLFPFIILMMIIIHLILLHDKGSLSPLGGDSWLDKVVFMPYFILKDLVGFVLCLYIYIIVCVEFPFMFMDVENFIMCNSLVTPVHILPEWYFLFAYAILRSVMSKMGGVVALLMSVVYLYVLPFVVNNNKIGFNFLGLFKNVFWIYVVVWMILSWLGSCEVEYPFDILSQMFSFIYFLIVVFIMLIFY